MARIYGFSGKLVGKKGDAVFSVRHGKQLMSQYNPIKNDRKSSAQVAIRSRMKLMTQLASVMAPYYVMPKKKGVKRHGQFIKCNFVHSYFTLGAAQANVKFFSLTQSYAAMSDFKAERNAGSSVQLELLFPLEAQWQNVVYTIFKVNQDNQYEFVSSTLVQRDVGGEVFACSIPDVSETFVAFAYAFTVNDGVGSLRFMNIESDPALALAYLGYEYSQSSGGMQFSKTKGLVLQAGSNYADSVQSGQFNLSLNPSSECPISGLGSFELGQTATLVADVPDGYAFVKFVTSTGLEVSSNPWVFDVQEDMEISVVIRKTHFHIQATNAYGMGGSVSGGGIFEAGQSVVLSATPAANWVFKHWLLKGRVVSTDSNITVNVTEDAHYRAAFSNPDYFEIIVEDWPMEGCSSSGSGLYPMWATHNLEAHMPAGAKFEYWDMRSFVVGRATNYSGMTMRDELYVPVITMGNQCYIRVRICFEGRYFYDGLVGEGFYNIGDQITIQCPNSIIVDGVGRQFAQWQENGARLSNLNTYTFTVGRSMCINALYLSS